MGLTGKAMAIAKATTGRGELVGELTGAKACARILVEREDTVHFGGAGALDALVHGCRQYELGAETERVGANEGELDRLEFAQWRSGGREVERDEVDSQALAAALLQRIVDALGNAR